MDPMVCLRNVSKSFGVHKVLNGIDLDVAAGEAKAIIGPSGSGKSTLLRCINCLELPSGGTVEIAGQPMLPHLRTRRARERHLNAMRSQVGMVFQRFNLFPHRTTLGNVMEGLTVVRGFGRAEAEDRARAMLDRVGMGEKRDAYPGQLSGGQQQRVAIARALVMEPKVMLFDEATSSLDPELVGEVLMVMRQLAADGLTMIVVTHEMGFAREIAHDIAFMDHGEIIEQGPPDKILSNPTQERTRSFLRQVLKT